MLTVAVNLVSLVNFIMIIYIHKHLCGEIFKVNLDL